MTNPEYEELDKNASGEPVQLNSENQEFGNFEATEASDAAAETAGVESTSNYESVFREGSSVTDQAFGDDSATELLPEVSADDAAKESDASDISKMTEAELAAQREHLAQQKERLAQQQAEITARQEAYLAEQEALAEQQAALERQQAQLAAERAAEAARLEAEAAARLEQQRAERDRLLGTVRAERAAEPKIVTVSQTVRSTDKFAGAFGLFLLRLVVAGILGIRGYQRLIDIDKTVELFKSVIPEGYVTYAAWGVGIVEILCAALLLFGLATRLAGFLVFALYVAIIVLFCWGNFNPFAGFNLGFSGEFELLLAVVGLMLCFLGSGRVGLDAKIRLSRNRVDEEDEEESE